MTTPLEFLEIGKPMLNFLNMNFPIYDGKESRSDEKQHNNVQKDYEKKKQQKTIKQTNQQTNEQYCVLRYILHLAKTLTYYVLLVTTHYTFN